MRKHKQLPAGRRERAGEKEMKLERRDGHKRLSRIVKQKEPKSGRKQSVGTKKKTKNKTQGGGCGWVDMWSFKRERAFPRHR